MSVFAFDPERYQVVTVKRRPAVVRRPSGRKSTRTASPTTVGTLKSNVSESTVQRERASAGTGVDLRLWVSTPNRKLAIVTGDLIDLEWPKGGSNILTEIEQIRPGAHAREFLVRDLSGRGELGGRSS